MADSAGVATDFRDRRVGDANELPAVAGSHHRPNVLPPEAIAAEQLAEQFFGQGVLLDALVDRLGSHRLAAVGVQQQGPSSFSIRRRFPHKSSFVSPGSRSRAVSQ